MNIKNSLFRFLKKHKHSFEDIDFVISTIETDDGQSRVEIEKEDFLTLASNVDESDLTLGLFFVGKDFYVTSDSEEGFWSIINMPKRPKKKINVAKMALLSDTSVEVAAGIKFNE